MECWDLALQVSPWAWVGQVLGCLDDASNNSHELCMPSFLVADVLSILQNLCMDCRTVYLAIISTYAHMLENANLAPAIYQMSL